MRHALSLLQDIYITFRAFSRFFYPKRLSHLCKATASLSGAVTVRCLAQGHLDTQQVDELGIKLATFRLQVTPLCLAATATLKTSTNPTLKHTNNQTAKTAKTASIVHSETLLCCVSCVDRALTALLLCAWRRFTSNNKVICVNKVNKGKFPP